MPTSGGAADRMLATRAPDSLGTWGSEGKVEEWRHTGRSWSYYRDRKACDQRLHTCARRFLLNKMESDGLC